MEKTTWNSDPTHSELGFKIKHLMISNVSGTFGNFQVHVETDGDDFRSAVVHASADLSSISTNNEQRDRHLRTSDFFEAERFPQLVFHSTKIEQIDAEEFYIYGNLTMKGIAKPVKFAALFSGITKDPWGGVRAGFEINGKINRSDWGISFNSALETGGVMLSEEVKISSEVELVKVSVPVPA